MAQQLEQGVLLPAEQAAFLHGGLPVRRGAQRLHEGGQRELQMAALRAGFGDQPAHERGRGQQKQNEQHDDRHFQRPGHRAENIVDAERFVRGLRYSSKQHVFPLFIVNFIEIYRSFLYRIRP